MRPDSNFRVLSPLSSLSSLSLLLTFSLTCACDSDTPSKTGGEEAGEVAGTTSGTHSGQEAGTSSGQEAGTSSGTSSGQEAGTSETPQSCTEGEGFAPGRAAFVERTLEVGLEGVMGTLMSVADINGDGWPDLVVRRGGVRADLLEPSAPKQHTWVMLNRGGRFEDFTEASNFLATRGSYDLAVGRPNWVVVFGDVDNDGDVDAYSGIDMRSPPTVELDGVSVVVDQERSELLLNDGEGHFTLTYAQDPLRRVGQEDVPSGAAFIDADRDGWLDLWMSQGGLGAPLQDRLFKNLGRGEFEDITTRVGLTTQPWEALSDLNEGRAHSTAWSATACDLNGDGAPELLAASYGRAPNHLWRAEGQGDALSYSNQSVASGYAFDDNRGWGDNQFARCYCQANPNAEGCEGAERPLIGCSSQNWRHELDREPFRLGGNSGATVCEDLDGDGDLDLYTTEIRHWWAGEGSDASEVLINDGAGVFTRPGREALGLTLTQSNPSWDEGHITAGAFDFDNDGLQDLYLGGTDYPGNRGHLYHNLSTPEAPRFEELSLMEGFEHNRSHGVVSLDFDGDGDLDVIVGHSRMRCGAEGDNPCYMTQQVRLFENVVGQEQSWLQLSLVGGEGSNRDAVGARVEVTVPATETTPSRLITRYVQAGYGHFGQQSERLIHVGLGEACEAEVRVIWPNAALTEQRFTLSARQRYLVRQGEAPTPITLPSF